MTNETDHERYETGLRLWRDWTRMWNGQPELALGLVAERFALHLVTPSALEQTAVVDPAAVERWVRAHRANFARLVFHTGCGPFVDVRAGVVAGPWYAEASTDGSPRVVCGMDTIAFNLPGAGVQTIKPHSALPYITDPLTLDGYTQPGSSPNSNGLSEGINARLLVEIDLGEVSDVPSRICASTKAPIEPVPAYTR